MHLTKLMTPARAKRENFKYASWRVNNLFESPCNIMKYYNAFYKVINAKKTMLFSIHIHNLSYNRHFYDRIIYQTFQ